MGVTAEPSQDAAARDGADAPEEERPAQEQTPSQSLPSPAAVEERLQKLRDDISRRTSELLAQGPDWLASHTLNELNAQAAKLQKAGDLVGAIATYHALFAKARRSNITHPELYVCHSNCSGAYLALGMFTEAAAQADSCQTLAYGSLRRNYKGGASYVKSFLRKGQALLGLGANRLAADTLEKGLEIDPFNLDMKKALMDAQDGILRDLAEGRGLERKLIEYPEPNQRISYHPYAAPLHRIKTDDMLPLRLLSPYQAENDHHIKDTYNYLTIQTDIRMPKRHLRVLEDAVFNGAYQRAIQAAVQAVCAEDKDCRVLNLGSGAGLHAMMALRAGAHHVTAVERWLYLALTTQECLEANKFSPERYTVLYKRPTDLKLRQDVPVCCNLLLANIFDEGLLTSGIIPSVRHALSHLLTDHAVLLPASATVYLQAVELRTGEVCGLDMRAANLYRWHPAYAAGVPLDRERIRPLSKPQEVWYFDLGAPPEKSAVKTVDLEFTEEGRFNAVMFWFKLHLHGDIYLSTGPEAVEQGLRCLQPALQYIAGELAVEPGLVMPAVASHNTVRMRFDVESTDYLHLHKTDATFPPNQFAMLADEERCQAYQRAIQRVVRQRKQTDGEAHVLDIGCGSGMLSLLAAKAGASSVVACDLQESLCDLARKTVAANRVGRTVNVVSCDAGVLQRGKQVRPLGVNVVVADFFDAGLLGDGFPWVLDLAQRKVVQPGAAVVPAAATVYCMGIEALTGAVAGFDMSPINRYRWDNLYEATDLSDLPHRRLTKPCKVLEHFFDGERRGKTRESLLKLEVIAEGTLNAVAFWFDLHLDDTETLTNAPDGIGEGGVLLDEVPCSSSKSRQQPGHAAGGAVGGKDRQGAAGSPTSVCQESELPGAASTASAASLAGAGSPAQPDSHGAADFLPSASFAGAREGYAFKLGELGLGYYPDGSAAAAAPQASLSGTRLPATHTGAAAPPKQQQQAAPKAAEGKGVADAAASGGEGTSCELVQLPPLGRGPRHHWGQALQYLDRSVAVQPGRSAMLLVRREDGRLHFSLRAGVGEAVPRPPWKVEWGGGSSVENPHVQRVQYCRLLVTDFLQRVRCKRFPPIEKDMRMVLAQCGSLLLDPAALQEVYHEMVVLEKLHTSHEFSPAAALEALTKRPLRHC